LKQPFFTAENAESAENLDHSLISRYRLSTLYLSNLIPYYRYLEENMSLYFVRHQHNAETCPAKDPAMGNMLLTHINPLNARKLGVQIRGDAVIDGQHTFVLILEAEDKQKIENFMQPFSMAGTVEIYPASECETVVERAGC
jgi:Domain of unknown function (DUF3303)